jgi:hypothetical protein
MPARNLDPTRISRRWHDSHVPRRNSTNYFPLNQRLDSASLFSPLLFLTSFSACWRDVNQASVLFHVLVARMLVVLRHAAMVQARDATTDLMVN